MGSVSLTGQDSQKINNRIFKDFADADCAVITFPNELATVKKGKNGNAIFGKNEQGSIAEQVLRLVRGSADDKFMNSLLVQQDADFAAFPTLIGEFVKRIGDGSGSVQNDTYVSSGGVFIKRVEAKSNVEGDTDQSVSTYHLKWANCARAIT